MKTVITTKDTMDEFRNQNKWEDAAKYEIPKNIFEEWSLMGTFCNSVVRGWINSLC